MPQGPAHLHVQFGDDGTAWNYLKRLGFTNNKGMIHPPYRSYSISEEEWDAITYLAQEWDWDFSRAGAPEGVFATSWPHQYRRWAMRRLAGALRVRDKHVTRLQMWWYCRAKDKLREWWYTGTGRRAKWEELYGSPCEWWNELAGLEVKDKDDG